jgi:hypothetical protein
MLVFDQGTPTTVSTGRWTAATGSGDFKADGTVAPTATWNFNQQSITNATYLSVRKALDTGFMWGTAGDGWKYTEIDEGVPVFAFFYNDTARLSYGAAGWDWQGNVLHSIADGSLFNDAVAYGQLTAATNSVYIMGTNYSYGIALTMYGLLDPRITGLELRTNAWNVAETNARAATAASLVDRITGASATNSFATAAQGTKADNAVTNNGCTINGQSIANGAALTISGTGSVSSADCTNIAQTVVAASLARFSSTNTIAVTNSTTFSIGLPSSSVCLDDVRVFATTPGVYSKRYALRFFRSADFRRTHLAYTFTNGLIYATTTTVAQAVGAITNVVPDASGIVWPIDMYWQDAGGTTNDYVSFTNATATVLWGCCTNTIAMPAGSLISHVEQLGSFNFWGGTNLYGDIVPTTGWTGTVQIVIDGARK